MNSVLSFLPDNFQRFSQLYGREDLACNRQHPSPVLKAQHVGKQQHPPSLKRKLTNGMDPLPKRQRQDGVANGDEAVLEMSPPSLPSSSPPVPAPATTTPVPTALPTTATALTTAEVVASGAPSTSLSASTSPGHAIATSDHPLPQPQPLPASSDSVTTSDPAMEVRAKNSVVDRIGAHLNLQILLKHEELRLIETEMAKCRIALEQLRRVHAIPYPDSSASLEPVYSAATSSTPALAPQPGFALPTDPPPMGVTDGPYTRHYARWLLPDDKFDPIPPRTARGVPSAHVIPSRKRPTLEEVETPKPKRASTSMFQQLPVASGTTRSLIVQRPGGKWVKIICKLCGKDDSANLQGFTNHTRIKHGIVYPTHLDAMNDCGHELSDEEAAQADAVIGSMAQQPAHSVSAVTTPISLTGNMAHPLLVGPSRQSASAKSLQASLAAKPRQHRPKPETPSSSSSSSPTAQQAGPPAQFIPYLGTPSLSKLLEKRGSSLNLQQLGSDAAQRIDLNQVEIIPAEDDVLPSPSSEVPTRPVSGPFGSSRMPARAPPPASLEIEKANSYTESPIDTPMQDSHSAERVSATTRNDSVIASSFSDENAGLLTAESSVVSSAAPSPLVVGMASGTSSANIKPSLSPESTAVTNPGLIPDDEEEDDDHSSCMHQSDRDDASTTSAHFHVQDEHDHHHHHHGGSPHGSYVFHAYQPEGVNKETSMANGVGSVGYGVPRKGSDRVNGSSMNMNAGAPKKKRGRPRKNA